MKVCHGEGEGLVIYVGTRYLSVGFRGFSGWRSYPKWMPGGWEFFSPHIGVGRIGSFESHYAHGHIVLPAKLVHLWRMRRSAYRAGMRQVPR